MRKKVISIALQARKKPAMRAQEGYGQNDYHFSAPGCVPDCCPDPLRVSVTDGDLIIMLTGKTG
jgi:hypothetical protein